MREPSRQVTDEELGALLRRFVGWGPEHAPVGPWVDVLEILEAFAIKDRSEAARALYYMCGN